MLLSSYSDTELVEMMQKDSTKAFESIYRRYWYKLFGAAYHALGSKEEAEELIQDIFENLWNKRETSQIQHLGAYLMVSVKHRCTNYIKSQINFRKYQEYLIFQEIHEHQAPENIVHYDDLVKAVEKALKNLPEKTCKIFKRSRFEHQSIRQIAQEFDLTEKAVEYHITKSLKVLKDELKYYHTNN